MLLSFTLLTLGLLFVVKGADFLIDGATALARRLQISEIVIGLTIVAFGTSAPELVVNVFSSFSGKDELVLGNVIGSNIFNILLILGVAGLIFPLDVQRNSVRREIPFSLLSVIILFLLANDHFFSSSTTNRLSRLDGIILLFLFLGFIVYAFILSKEKNIEHLETKSISRLKTLIYLLLGFFGLFMGGKLVVDNAVNIAVKLQVSDKLIGLTIVSMGTSLPELATSAVAAYKKRSDLAVGNILGSNIFNIFLILGVSSVIHPIQFPSLLNTDLYFLGFGTLLLFVGMFTGKSRKLDRWEAAILLIIYILYMIFIILRK